MRVRESIAQQQERLGAILIDWFPDKKITLSKTQEVEVESMLRELKELHGKSMRPYAPFSWQEILASYEVARKSGVPTRKSIAEKIGMKDYQCINSDILFKEVEDHGYSINIDHKKRPETRDENVRKFNIAYKVFRGKMLPTSEEISERTGISQPYVNRLSKLLKKPLLNSSKINKKIVLESYRELANRVNIDSMNANKIAEYIKNKGHSLSNGTVKKWVRHLRREKLIPYEKESIQEYRDLYIGLVMDEIAKGKKAEPSKIATRMSLQTGRKITVYDVSKLRNSVLASKLRDCRYTGLVEHFKNNPNATIDSWSSASGVPREFVQDFIKNTRRYPEITKILDVPNNLESLLKKEEYYAKTLEALKNPNRIRILKSLAEKDGRDSNEIIRELNNGQKKPNGRLKEHIKILEETGMVYKRDNKLFLGKFYIAKSETPTITQPKKDVFAMSKEAGLNYMRIREVVEQILHGIPIYQTQLGDDNESMKYMNFINDNFVSICRRMNAKPVNVKLYYDGKDGTYVLKAK